MEMDDHEITQETLLQEDQLQRKWHQACREEEKYWQQKSRSLWLEAGDKNTSYFHKQVEARKQFKKVTEIQVQDQIITDFEGIKAAMVDAFETLYTETQRSAIDPKAYPLSLVPTLIQDEVNNNLTKVVNQQEIKEALDQMSPDKAPGPDGFTSRFYQHSWDIIKSDFTKLIRNLRDAARLEEEQIRLSLLLFRKKKEQSILEGSDQSLFATQVTKSSQK
jgi:hypothetical protein